MKLIRRFAWVLIAAAAALVAAPGAYAETKQETANKKVVIGYFAGLDRLETINDEAQYKKELRAIMKRYCRDDYNQHNEAMAVYGQGTTGLIKMFESQRWGPNAIQGSGPPSPSHVITVMAQGDMVVRINTRSPPNGGTPTMIFNLFRLQNGLIAEHWDGSSGVSPIPAAPKAK